MSRQIFLDTETTGLSAENGDRIIEIGCIEMVNRQLTGRNLHHYLNPQRPNHPDAVRVHGLSDEFLADKPLFARVAEELLDYLSGAELVIHNADFDIGFINEELRRLQRPPIAALGVRVTDSLQLARDAFPGKSNSLDALCRRLEVDASSRTVHGALLDAGLLAEVYLRMTRGQESLVIDGGEGAQRGDGPAWAAIDLSAYELIVVEPDAAELAAHAAVLADLDKASGSKTLWHAAMA